jgi:phosphoglycolate phosphatase
MAGTDYDFWLLDLDGTVVDIERSYIHEVVGEVGDRLGRAFTDAEAELLWYGIGNARETVLSRADVEPERFWAVFHEVEDPAARTGATYVYDDAASVVPGIDRPVGLVTHCQANVTEPVLDALDIGDWFDTVVCCTDETGWKPDPTPVELAMRGLGVADGQAGAMAGDDPGDVQAAHNAGLDGIHVSRPGRNWDGDRVAGDRRVSTLRELGV